MTTVATSFGEVPLETLVKRYESERQREAKKYEKRLEFIQTDEGKAWNRAKAKAYYERNKEKILLKRKEIYKSKKETSTTPGS